MRRGNAKLEAFDLRCYDVVQKSVEPIAAKTVAEQLGCDWLAVRPVLDRLERQKALCRKRIRGAWRYYI
jgi:hypothetical protein